MVTMTKEQYDEIYTDENQGVLYQFRYAVEQTLDKYPSREYAVNLLYDAFPHNKIDIDSIVNEYERGIRMTEKDAYKRNEQ